MSEIKDELTSHDYDGIQEYNNPLPMWWLWTFFGTIIFAFIYYLHYESGSGPTSQQELDKAMAAIEARQTQHQPQNAISNGDLESQLKQADLKNADSHFQSKCAACHGNAFQGGIGPNLTDAFWIHGKGDAESIIKVVKDGILDKGMPAWGAMLKDKDIVDITALIISKQDSNPANAKAAQGEKVR